MILNYDLLNILSLLLLSFIICYVFYHIGITIQKIRKLKNTYDKPFHKLYFCEQIINLEIELIIIVFIFLLILIINKGENDFNMLKDILINVLCSLFTSISVTIFIYYKFLKHIPQETENKINNLLNDRLNHETYNHNAVLHKADTSQNFLSNEHSEIQKNLKNVEIKIYTLSSEMKSDKEQKNLQYSILKDNDKDIVDNINKIYALGESLKELNSENIQLKNDKDLMKRQIEHLTKQNIILQNEIKNLKQQENVNLTPKNQSRDFGGMHL